MRLTRETRQVSGPVARATPWTWIVAVPAASTLPTVAAPSLTLLPDESTKVTETA